MVQVLQRAPGFGEQLIGALSGAGQDIASGLQKRWTGQADQKIMEGFADPSKTPMEIIQSAMRLSPEAQKNISPWVTQLLKNQQTAQPKPLTAQQQLEQQEKEGIRAASAENLKHLKQLNEEYGSTIGGPFQTPASPLIRAETFKARKEIDSLGLWETDRVYTHFNKGQMSDTRFKGFQEKLAPHSRLSKAENNARIESLERVMKLPQDASANKIDALMKKEEKRVEAVAKKEEKKGGFLTPQGKQEAKQGKFSVGQKFEKEPSAIEAGEGKRMSHNGKIYVSKDGKWVEE